MATQLILDSPDSLVGTAADSQAVRMPVVLDTELGSQDRLAAVVRSRAVAVGSQAAERSHQDSRDNHQPAVVAAGNSCMGCNRQGVMEQLDMAGWVDLLDMALLDLHTRTHIQCTHAGYERRR